MAVKVSVHKANWFVSFCSNVPNMPRLMLVTGKN